MKAPRGLLATSGVAERAVSRSAAVRLELRKQSYPGLIEADRDRLVPAYIALYEKRLAQLRKPVAALAATLGSSDALSVAIPRAGVAVKARDPELSAALASRA